ncbi:hypothetical protein SELMODRAFT_441511 [Selaginella moellendorffii]|uniref:Glycosyl hydrolase family 32 N-terminal domain-containing protein n=1 Tax=Selaginella moellendorffii TaxID=88036 RepID=D8RK70_SELML|nr:hypothetical protein SELMODRAFT_441511 [Selaginella moellendorffii]
MVLGFHFQAPPNSSIRMISPNAPVFCRGFYHLFYRFTTPSSSKSKNQSSWGHAIAKDLLHWPRRWIPGQRGSMGRICISLLLARPDFFVEWLRRSSELVLELVKVLLTLMVAGIRGDPFLVLTRRSGGHDNVPRSVGIEPSAGVFSSKGLQATSCERTGNWSKKEEALVELRASMKGKKKENEYRGEAKSVFSSLGLKDGNSYASADDFLVDLSSAIEIMKMGLGIRPKQEKARCLLQNMILFQDKLECMTALLNPRDARHELLDLAVLQKSVQALREELEKGKELLGDHVKRLLSNRWDLREWQ